MKKTSAFLATALIFSSPSDQFGDAASAQDHPESRTTESVRDAFKTNCEAIIYEPLIPEEAMEWVRNRLSVRYKFRRDEQGNVIRGKDGWPIKDKIVEDVSDASVRAYLIDRFDLLGPEIELPDLRTNPRAGRDIKITLSPQDQLGQSAVSQEITCTLPEYAFYNEINWKFADIRGDLAEATTSFNPDEVLSTKLPELSVRFEEIFVQEKENIKTPETLDQLAQLSEAFSGAKTMEDLGRVMDDMWVMMMALEEDHLTESGKMMEKARESLREKWRSESLDKEEEKELVDQMLEAMEKFLDEQIERAKEEGDEELQKQLEEMKKQLEEMRKQLEQLEELSKMDVYNVYDMMREMMNTQEDMNSQPSPSEMQQMMQKMMQNQQSMMQQMMQRMQNRLMDQRAMQELQKLIEQQQELMDQTGMTEEERQERNRELQETLDDYAENLQERIEKVKERQSEKAKKDSAVAIDEQNEIRKQLERDLEELTQDIKQRAENQETQGLDEDDLDRLQEIQEQGTEALEKLQKSGLPSEKNTTDIFEQMQRATEDIDRMEREAPQQQAAPPQAESRQSLDPDALRQSTRDAIERMEDGLQRLEQSKRGNQEQTKQNIEEAQQLEQMGKDLKDLKEMLEGENISEDQLREALEKMGEIQEELQKREELDMEALQQMLRQFIGQLEGRIDEVGAKQYMKERVARRTGAADEADNHDANQIRAVELGGVVSGVTLDLAQRADARQPMTRAEAEAAIGQLGAVKEELDAIEPPPPGDPQNQNGGGQAGQQGLPMQPDELMQRLMELMGQQQQQDGMQQQIQQMMQELMQRSNELQRQQEQMQQRIEQLRQQLEKMGIDPEQVDRLIQRMEEASGQMGQGKPGGSMPGQSGAMQHMMQMMEQLQRIPMPGQGRGPGNGTGRDSPDGQSTDTPSARDATSGESEIDPDALTNQTRETQDRIRQLLRGELSDAERRYYEDLLSGDQGNGQLAPRP